MSVFDPSANTTAAETISQDDPAAALRKFVFGETDRDRTLKGAEETKKDQKDKKATESKRQDTKSTKTGDAIPKQLKPPPSAAPKRSARVVEETNTVEEEEQPHIRPPRPVRKSDLGNPVVRDYLTLYAKQQGEVAKIPLIQYFSSDSSSIDDSSASDGELISREYNVDDSDQNFNSDELGTPVDPLDHYFSHETERITESLAAEKLGRENELERHFLKVLYKKIHRSQITTQPLNFAANTGMRLT